MKKTKSSGQIRSWITAQSGAGSSKDKSLPLCVRACIRAKKGIR